ncbi:MAG: hypothetical protein E6Q67_09000 [Roseateles sp.]|nr:MAG: hypothetical protein E6Q67_09000 [Roseateles sp.]
MRVRQAWPRLGGVLWVLCGLWICAPSWASPQAYPPSLPLQRTVYTPQQGAPTPVNNLVQGRDGLLWIGSDSGLVSFDGVQFRHFVARRGPTLPNDAVYGLALDSQGDLWVGFRFGGVYRIRDGVVTPMLEGLPQRSVMQLLFDAQGTAWAGTPTGIFRWQAGRWVAELADDGQPLAQLKVGTMAFDRQGALWVDSPRGLYRRAPGGTLQRVHDSTGFSEMVCDEHGDLWWSMADRLMALSGERPQGPAMPQGRAKLWPVAVERAQLHYVDRTGQAWLSDGQGLLRASAEDLRRHVRDPGHAVPVSRLPLNKGEGDSGLSILLDREGNLWLSSSYRLEKLQPRRLQALELAGRPLGAAALAVDGAGSLWLAHLTEGLLQVPAGATAPQQRVAQVNWDASALAADAAGVAWVSPVRSLQLAAAPGALPHPLPGGLNGRARPQSLARLGDTLWLAMTGTGLHRLGLQGWEAVGPALGLPAAPPLSLFADERDASLWLGYTDQQVWRVRAGHAQGFGPDQGLDMVGVLAMAPGRGGLWLGGRDGVAWFDGRRFRRLLGALAPPLQGVSGLVETPEGELWFNGVAGVGRISREELLAWHRDSRHRPAVELFAQDDGLEGFAPMLRPVPSAARTPDGRLWFATKLGVFWLDPSRVLRNPIAAQALIQAVRTGEQELDPRSPALPRGARSLEIDYTAASLTRPAGVRFWYRLEGVDEGWQAAGARRSALYSNLAPGDYRFEVVAANEDGLRGPPTALVFSIPAAFWQTGAFKLLLLAVGLLLLWGAHRLRLRAVSQRWRLHLEGRLAERGRIARDLHDHLLQGVQALVLRLHVIASDLRPEDKTRHRLEGLLEEAEALAGQTRDQVSGLRLQPTDLGQLFNALQALGQGLAASSGVQFEARLQGRPGELSPAAAEEVYGVAREALSNAFRHARPQRVWLTLGQGEAGGWLSVRDDGVGFAPAADTPGEPGHWGLLGMRERAQRLGARLTWHRPAEGGTELHLAWPAQP